MNLILQAIKSLFRKLEAKIPKKLSDLVNDLNISTPDWNQNNPKGEGYIKNRPFYEECSSIIVVKEQKITVDETGRAELAMKDLQRYPEYGEPFTVVFDGVRYEGEVYIDADSCYHTDFTTKDGIAVQIYDYIYFVATSELAGEHTISITVAKIVTHKIDEKYLPDKMDATNPVGTGSFSMNRLAGTNIGSCSHVEGEYNTASGYTSHAEGYHTIASGYTAHAEGYRTTASGYTAHAEGEYATASSNNTHAEGYYTTASGLAAHAEGFETDAVSAYQHVQGKYNVVDTAAKYAHIVGNGTTNAKRSNAHTLDWKGLGWFAGGLKVGGTGQDDKAAVEVALKTDIPSTIVQSVNGVTPDENGNIVLKVSGGGSIDDEHINSLIDAKLEGVSALVDEINGEVI